MPTPYGSRGGMAFSADELRVLRRALAIAFQSDPVTTSLGPLGPDRRAEEVRVCLHLSEAVDEAVREGERLRAFLLDELARYRAALPGAAVGYLDRLQGALSAGYEPLPEDLTALRRLCAAPVGADEAERRHILLFRCERAAERGVRAPTDAGAEADAGVEAEGEQKPGGPGREPGKKPEGEPRPREPRRREPEREEPRRREPQREEPQRREPDRTEPKPSRPVPTPAEVFPPKRRPAPPPPERESGEPEESGLSGVAGLSGTGVSAVCSVSAVCALSSAAADSPSGRQLISA